MANLSPLEKLQFEDLFGMRDGYVMGKDIFSQNKFSEFFRSVAGIDIFSDRYSQGTGSKANRLRAFWNGESDPLVGKVLHEMLKVWEYHNDNCGANKAFVACQETVKRLMGQSPAKETTETDFLKKSYSDISIKKLKIEAALMPILENRIKEVNLSLQHDSPLAAVILTGSILEGILLGTALNNMQKFNQATASPRDKEGTVLKFDRWTLGSFIDVAYETGLLSLDVKKFSYPVRDFRNFIHPYEHMASQFSPDKHTAEICLQVLKAAIADLSGER